MNKMLRFTALLVILVTLVATGTITVSANSGNDGNAPLYKNPVCACPDGATPNGPTFGEIQFKIVNGNLVVEVVLKGAEPKASYDLHIHQFIQGDTTTCEPNKIILGAIVTDKRGDAHILYLVPFQPGATLFWFCVMHGMDMSLTHFVTASETLKNL